jgi:hypothetical protein
MRLPKEQAEVINQFFSYIVGENPLNNTLMDETQLLANLYTISTIFIVPKESATQILSMK